ncbi:MAG TPA: LLM class flavin-dependent oxidoreductase [Chloroflexota bacterium]|jgi:5,10-methylenetetrahydromethanopterin reductase|nr:LLM class flavin-dependent oxidoreductase [Chloroflexota bacterium]
MEFGIAFQSNKQPAAYVALAQAVDRFKFDVVSVYNDLLFQPALGPLLFMAPHLRRARLGPAALNPYTVHPLEIAGQIALLDMATDGRAYLGLARGAWLDALSINTPKPVQTLREAAGLVQHLLARKTEAFQGQVFQLQEGATLRYEPRRPGVPLTIGTWGLKTAELAGEIADEIKIGGSANPAMVRRLRPALDRGARRAGRDPNAVGVCVGAVTVVDQDARVARARAQQEVALYLPVVAPLDPTVSQTDEDPLDLFAFAGDAASIIRQVAALADAGATRVEFGTPHGPGNPLDAIDLLGTRVLPYFT